MTQPIPQLPRARVITGAVAEQELHAMGLIPSNLTRSCVEAAERSHQLLIFRAGDRLRDLHLVEDRGSSAQTTQRGGLEAP